MHCIINKILYITLKIKRMAVPKKKKSKKKLIIPYKIPHLIRNCRLKATPKPHKQSYVDKKIEYLLKYKQDINNSNWVYFKKMQWKRQQKFYTTYFLKKNEQKGKISNKKKIRKSRQLSHRINKISRKFKKYQKDEHLLKIALDLKNYYKIRYAATIPKTSTVPKKSITESLKIEKPKDFYNLFKTYHSLNLDSKNKKKKFKNPIGREMKQNLMYLRKRNNLEIHNVWRRRWYYIPLKSNKYTYVYNLFDFNIEKKN